jgi:uncharacterized protein (DUF1330 family)
MNKTAIGLISAALIGVAAIGALKAQPKAPIYAVIDISEISDVDAYIKAVSAAEPKASQDAGGRFVIRASKTTALDGGNAPNRFVVIAFDTEEKAKTWYASVKDVNAVRMKVAKSRAFLVEGLAN